MATPMTHTSRLSPDQGTPLDSAATSEYRRLLGRLIYLTNTRPVITFAVHNLSQFISTPTTSHQQVACHILRYLKDTLGDGLFFPHENTLTLCGFNDSDWATCPTTRKSVTGYSIFIGSSLISWKSKKQQTISHSSSEVEYQAMATTKCEMQWISYLLHDLHIPATQPANLYCDNQSTIQISSNQVFHERTMHIEIGSHLVREKLSIGFLKLLPITS
ncbi:secreted RxLR effector protein 161-like [Phaseolus vulgaris]|uniref:secreted RxLR effector protein 161-like n=1 Tax=Phaseolus vulgaris TaxID=3885 RepID=UPI0035CB330A